ncbi:MAG TPA: hypothetical protein VIY66_04795 [Candidatus Acidoferrales bacterium]
MARAGFRISVTIVLGLLVVSLSQPAQGQGIGSTLVPRARVFPSIGPGVSALKRDSAGRYYILATPASVISIYDRSGALIGKIPNANSHGATIKYAVDIDLGQDGRIFVADRGANAIEIFNPDGSLAARVPVVAPTSVVALSKNQFAVTSLTSTHLVEIIDERGKVVRSFGDPAYITDEASKNRLVDWGRIAGDSANSIYFAFTTLTEPTLRKYDRFGYVGYEADIPESFFSGGDSGPRDRVEFGLNFTDLSLSERTSSWVSVGTSGDVKFGGGVGMGLNQAFASGGGFGRDAQQAGSQSSFSNTSYNFANDSLGGMFSGEVSSQGTRFHLGVGSLSGLGRGGRRGRGAAGATSSDQLDDQGGILQFFGSGSSFAAGSMQDNWGGDLYVSAQDLNSDAIPGTDISALLNSSSNVTPPALAFNSTLGVPGAFNAWSIFNARDFRPRGGFGWSGGLARASGQNGSSGSLGPSAAGAGFGHQRFAGSGSDGFARGSFPRWRFGAGATSIAATARVNLGNLGGNSTIKPEITAVSVDPATQEMWVGVGDALMSLSKDGTPIGIYYLTINGDVPLQPSALLVEPDRFLVAADPWGIFEFDRPDRPRAINHALTTPPQLSVQPQVISKQ